MSKQEPNKRGRERTPNNRTTTGYRISDELWKVLQPLLPVHVNTHRFGGGRPRVPDRECAHSTAHDRFQEWVKAEVFLKLWQVGSDKLLDLK